MHLLLFFTPLLFLQSHPVRDIFPNQSMPHLSFLMYVMHLLAFSSSPYHTSINHQLPLSSSLFLYLSGSILFTLAYVISIMLSLTPPPHTPLHPTLLLLINQSGCSSASLTPQIMENPSCTCLSPETH